jgi:hypothetical protein
MFSRYNIRGGENMELKFIQDQSIGDLVAGFINNELKIHCRYDFFFGYTGLVYLFWVRDAQYPTRITIQEIREKYKYIESFVNYLLTE